MTFVTEFPWFYYCSCSKLRLGKKKYTTCSSPKLGKCIVLSVSYNSQYDTFDLIQFKELAIQIVLWILNRFGAWIGWWIAGIPDELLAVHELCDSGASRLCPKTRSGFAWCRDPVLKTLQKCSPQKISWKEGIGWKLGKWFGSLW